MAPRTGRVARPTPSPPASARRARGGRSEAGQETRLRLLDAAEELFARRGLDAVSVRDITERAGANIAAIHYHFGTKNDLIAAIFERRAPTLGERRDELLAELETRDEVTVRDVLRVMVTATAELVESSDGGRNYVAFLCTLGDHVELMHLVMAYDEHTPRFLKALAQVTPELSDDVRVLRFAIGKDLVNRLLGQPGGQVRMWVERMKPGATGGLVEHLVDILVGMFAAPVTASGPAPANMP
jgi:AcrR family transcriptional regulator